VESLQRRPGLTSVIAGVIFGAGQFVFGGGSGLVGVILAAALGAVFGGAMYATTRAMGRRSD